MDNVLAADATMSKMIDIVKSTNSRTFGCIHAHL